MIDYVEVLRQINEGHNLFNFEYHGHSADYNLGGTTWAVFFTCTYKELTISYRTGCFVCYCDDFKKKRFCMCPGKYDQFKSNWPSRTFTKSQVLKSVGKPGQQSLF